MYPLNDKDLDRLSRDAAEHYDVESSASGWERLENRLDKELPVKKDRRRFLFWLTFVALLTGGSLVYMLGRTPAGNSLASDAPEAGTVGKVPAAGVRKAEADKKANETSISVQKQKDQQQKDSQANNPAPATTTGDVAKNAPAVPVSTNAAAKTNDKTIDKSSDPTNNKSISNNSPVARNQPRKLKPREKQFTAGNSNDRSRKPVKNKTVTTVVDDQTAQTTIDLMKTTMPVIDGSKLYENGVIKKDIPAPAAEVAKKPEVKKQPGKQSKWEFGLLTGPDFSSVGFKNNYKTGLNVGAIIGYRISNRLQVNTGLVYTKKFYKVDGEDFYPPKHSWLSYQDVVSVKGDYSMFEIPVNLRYDFAYNQKSRWFASTGVSSYIMTSQNYDCKYYNNLGQLREYPWLEDSTYSYLFSHLNFSIGYERAIGKNFSIQAEPYLRLPLKGLGYGSIDMNSYGMFLTFKYKPSARVKK